MFFADDDGRAWGFVAPFVGLAVAIFALVMSLRACRRKRLIDNLPTSKTQGVFIGLVDIKGTAECEQPITSYLAAKTCVYYSYEITERWSRLVTYTERDSQGRSVTRTRTETGWTTVASETRSTPFYLQDDTGHLLIRPEGARVEAVVTIDQTCTMLDPLYYGKGPATRVMNSDNVRHFKESVLPLQAPLFVVGQARERQDVVAPEIAADPHASDFLISTRSQAQVSGGLRTQFWLYLLLGSVATSLGHLIGTVAGGSEITLLSILIYLAEFFLFLAIFLIGWVVTVYNSLVELRQRVEQGWAQVDIQLKRRHDLIPNLIDSVKGYRDYESSTQSAITELRTQLSATPPGQAGADFQSVQGQVQMLKEAYPELKANENFLALQKSLGDTEQRIALARSYFNSIATFYNTRLQVVPDRYLASLGGMKPRPLMEANDFERAPVSVDLTPPPAPAVQIDLPPVPSNATEAALPPVPEAPAPADLPPVPPDAG